MQRQVFGAPIFHFSYSIFRKFCTQATGNRHRRNVSNRSKGNTEQLLCEQSHQ